MDFQLFFFALAVNVLWILGFFYACKIDYDEKIGDGGVRYKEFDMESKQILWKIKYYSIMWLGEYWSKPICTCPVCMSSLHSLWFFYFFQLEWAIVPVYLLYIFCLAGINSLIVSKFDL